MKTNWLKNIFRKKDKEKDRYVKIPEDIRMKIIEKSSLQVSRGVFFSTVIIVVSFLPVFMLTGQEGKLFHPLAYTKTFIPVSYTHLDVYKRQQRRNCKNGHLFFFCGF